VKELLDGHPLLRDVWVRGEISNFHHHTSGHMYFTLKDEQACVRCVMFRSAARGLKFRPEDGLRVVARGSVSVYEPAGQYQLYLKDMQTDGLGDLHLALRQLVERLKKEGLFAEELKRPLPKLPRKVGVVTSAAGAAWRDIQKVARSRYPNIHLILAPAQVQGEGAAASIIRGLELLNRLEDVDVIILARGGGALEDLWAFNDENLARAIRASRTPVVTGVGHEVDVTVADLAADLRAATPSNAAELAVPCKAELYETAGVLAGRLERAVRNSLARKRQVVERLAHSRVLSDPERLLAGRRQGVDDLDRRLGAALDRRLRGLEARRAVLAGRLDALSPLAVLARGYSVCRRVRDGRIVASVAAAAPGDALEVRVRDGFVDCTVDGSRPLDPAGPGAARRAEGGQD